ncbi:MAG: DNA-directed RNA polymerase subunit B'' [Methanobacteriaceae archaeon]
MKGNTWGLVDAFFDKYNLVDHHIKSYNGFVNKRIQDIIDITEPISLDQGKYEVEFGKFKIETPTAKEADGSKSYIFPTEARLRNLTYSAHMYLEMKLNRKDESEDEGSEFENIYIGELPVMLKSGVCNLAGLDKEELLNNGEDPEDIGGYFIVNGSERAVVTMEEIAPNKIILERIGEVVDRRAKAVVTSIKSGFRAKITLDYKKPRKNGAFLRISFPYVPGEIPLVILLRALGFSTDEEIITAISADDFNFQMIIADDIQVSDKDLKLDEDEMEGMSKEERADYLTMAAIKYIGVRVAKGMTEEYRVKRAEDVIDRYLLPHMGVEKDLRETKAIYLAEMTEMLLQVIFDMREPHDKDHYTNKRLRVSGDLMEDLFRVAFTNLTRDMGYQLERSLTRGKEPSVRQSVRSDVLTENIKHAIATGNWVGGRAGVSQLLDRTSYMGTLSHLRRVVSPLSRSQPHFEARDLHPTQFGKICPNETPEGPNCGLVKNLALMCKISEGSDSKKIKETIEKMEILN